MTQTSSSAGRLIIILLRAVLTVVIGLATSYFTYWIVAGLFQVAHLSYWFAILLAAIATIFVARFVWVHTGATPNGLAQSVILGAVLTGGIAFLAGFFGPMLLTPDSPQGPLVGLLFTGPLGLIVGGALGAAYWYARRRRGDNAMTQHGL